MSTRPLLLVKEFLTTIGIEYDEQIEEGKSILLELDGGVLLTFWIRESHIMVVSPLAVVSKKNEAKFYAECLAENFLAFPDKNRFFAVDKESRELTLMASWGVAETQFETFLENMTEFADLAKKWHAKLAQQHTPSDASHEYLEEKVEAQPHTMLIQKA